MEGVGSGWDVKLYAKGAGALCEDDYTCGICLNLVRDAVKTPCNHYFCQVCMRQWLQHHHACPMDQRLVRQSDITPATEHRTRLLAAEVQCASFDTCGWHGPLSDLESHQIDCPIPCSYGCGAKVRGTDMLKHSESCVEKPLPCESAGIGCAFIGSKIQLDKHLKECPYYQMRAAIDRIEQITQKHEDLKVAEEQRFTQLTTQLDQLTQMMNAMISNGIQQQQLLKQAAAKVDSLQFAGLLATKWGSNGNGDAQFDCPWGIAISPNGIIYVSDFRNHRVQAFHTETKQFAFKFGTHGQGDKQLNYPAGIALDENGYVYVCDQDNHRIQVFRAEGAWVRSIGGHGMGSGEFQHPRSVAVDRRGYLYVVDKGNNRVQILTPEGKFISSFGGNGQADGQLHNPCGIAIDSKQQVYVTDFTNNRVQVFTADGKFLRKFGHEGVQQGEFMQPHGIAVDANGVVYITELGNRRVQVFAGGDGSFIKMFGMNGMGDAQFKDPRGIAVNHAGLVYVSDTQKHNIQVFRLEGH